MNEGALSAHGHFGQLVYVQRQGRGLEDQQNIQGNVADAAFVVSRQGGHAQHCDRHHPLVEHVAGGIRGLAVRPLEAVANRGIQAVDGALAMAIALTPAAVLAHQPVLEHPGKDPGRGSCHRN